MPQNSGTPRARAGPGRAPQRQDNPDGVLNVRTGRPFVRHPGAVRTSRVTSATFLGCAVASTLMSAGCSPAVPDYRDGMRPTQMATATRGHCPSSAAQLPSRDDFGRLIGPGRPPADFRPVHAVRCTWTETYLDDAATRAEITVEEVRSPTITTALTASLELPDQEIDPRSHLACAAVATAPDYLVLVDADGRAFAPRAPQTPCGAPRDEVVRALAELPWTGYKTYRFRALAAQ